MIAKLRDSGEWPRLKRWTREEYHQLAETGLLQDVRVQLIGGEIVEMTPQGNRHCVAVGLIEEALRTAFGANHWVRVQMPLALLDDSEPEPDLAVVFGSPREWAEQPRGALVVVEVSDATLTFDVRRKASLYASGGIDDYWVLDLGERQLLVHREIGRAHV